MRIELAELRVIERETEIPLAELVRIIEQAIASAYIKHLTNKGFTAPKDDEVRVALDSKTGEISVYAAEYDEDGAVIGEAAVDLVDFGRIAANAAKQVIMQRLRDLSDDVVLGEFKGKEGQLVSGIVQQGSNPRMVYIDLGEVEAVLPPEEQVPGEEYKHGTRLRVYVTTVSRGPKGPQVVVSRTHPGLVRKLFELEVPELTDGTVEIVSVAREAGHRSKVAVRASIPGINAKGTCIGEMGRRVRAVMDQLCDEKIDLIDYSPNLNVFVGNALSPAKVTDVFPIGKDNKQVRVLVPDFQLSLAIGKDGQNARLAAKLTGAKIDIQPDSVMDGD
ncbi:transcription termination/antitermination protein NusA [Canibacter sp. lx-72]|uniref:transcription termination factor NusA n=1 Tax=Canibacter zhuwentaonis TaxID=2837491 RepID=UPI001BDD14F9|nr:transcription termination factor NusA [Canibacter zhuwentaonis]MBT1017744.1 transcription termination/antitermination protein NusA [Canibacter zhuwentaonis]MBT1034900.1 transcription termination/antitermination protein NusA [Canibacter zhuwentaonis]